MKNKWTKKDDKNSLKEGWGIFEQDDGVISILKYDEANIFNSDCQARAYVNKMAKQNSPMHVRAIEEVKSYQKLNKVKIANRIKIGDYYIDCGLVPRICTTSDYKNDDIGGTSLVNSSEGYCSIRHCAPEKVTKKKAEELKKLWIDKGEIGVMIWRGWIEEDAKEFIKNWRK